MILPSQIHFLWLLVCVQLIDCRTDNYLYNNDEDFDDEYEEANKPQEPPFKPDSYKTHDDEYDPSYNNDQYYNDQSNYHDDQEGHNRISTLIPAITTQNPYALYSSINKPYVTTVSYLLDDYKPTKPKVKLICQDKEHTCTPQPNCPLTRFDNFESIRRCTLTHSGPYGICCPPPDFPLQRRPKNELPISRKATKKIYPTKLKYYPNVYQNLYRSFDGEPDNYEERAKSVQKIERKLSARKLLPYKYSSEMAHHNFFGNHREALSLGLKGEKSISKALELAEKYFYKNDKPNGKNEITASTNIDPDIANASECPKEPLCTPKKYRSIDGSCNNHLYPRWGKAFSPYNRVLNPNYGDGINSPRLSKSKEALPNVREISVRMNRYIEPPASKLTLITMQFGQFIDHDFASAAPTRTQDGSAISCCRAEILANPTELKHPACFEIPISKKDPFFSQHNVTCMNFVRSIATPRSDCKLAPREQLNQPTAFIDGSQIYGSTTDTMKSLRAFEGGRLLSRLSNKVEILPAQTNGTCNVPGGNFDKCFVAGDPRVNENIDLAVVQTIFLREHNRIAKELFKLNPYWKDEKLYQETRAIVAAEIQHILYTEFLPAILSRQTLIQFGLLPSEVGSLNRGYDPKTNPMLFNGFATAAYRWHSSIQGKLQIVNSQDEVIGEVPLSATFNNPTLMNQPTMFDGLLYGMTKQPMQKIDEFFTKEVTDKLFRPWNSTFGLDIYSLNVQRGRDHGLKGYTSWLKQCGLPKVKSFKHLEQLIPKRLVNMLRDLYDSVHDIDLYVAGILEKHLPNSELGPLFSCLVAEQFRRLKYGDRFFYENYGQINSFSKEQLAEIKKVSIARLFCDNGNDIKKMQPHAFIVPNYWWNKRVSCNSELIPKMSLDPWSQYKKTRN